MSAYTHAALCTCLISRRHPGSTPHANTCVKSTFMFASANIGMSIPLKSVPTRMTDRIGAMKGDQARGQREPWCHQHQPLRLSQWHQRRRQTAGLVEHAELQDNDSLTRQIARVTSMAARQVAVDATAMKYQQYSARQHQLHVHSFQNTYLAAVATMQLTTHDNMWR